MKKLNEYKKGFLISVSSNKLSIQIDDLNSSLIFGKYQRVIFASPKEFMSQENIANSHSKWGLLLFFSQNYLSFFFF